MGIKWKIAIVTHFICGMLTGLFFYFGLTDIVKSNDYERSDYLYIIPVLFLVAFILVSHFVAIVGITRVPKAVPFSRAFRVFYIICTIVVVLYTAALIVLSGYSIYLFVMGYNIDGSEEHDWEIPLSVYTLFMIWNVIMQYLVLNTIQTKRRKELEALIASIGSDTPA